MIVKTCDGDDTNHNNRLVEMIFYTLFLKQISSFIGSTRGTSRWLPFRIQRLYNSEFEHNKILLSTNLNYDKSQSPNKSNNRKEYPNKRETTFLFSSSRLSLSIVILLFYLYIYIYIFISSYRRIVKICIYRNRIEKYISVIRPLLLH